MEDTEDDTEGIFSDDEFPDTASVRYQLRYLYSFKITFTDDENTGDSMAVFPASGPGSNAPLTNNATPNSETGSMNIASNRSTPSKKPALNLGALGALGYGDIHDDNDDKDVEYLDVKLGGYENCHFKIKF